MPHQNSTIGQKGKPSGSSPCSCLAHLLPSAGQASQQQNRVKHSSPPWG